MKRNIKIFRSLFVGMCLLGPFNTYSQPVKELLQLYMGEVRINKYPPIPKQLSLAENSRDVLTSLTPYQFDSIASVRNKAHTIAHLSGGATRNESLRQSFVAILVTGAKDADGGNAGAALDYLRSFRKEDFNAAAKDTLRALFRRKGAHMEKIIKLCSFLDMKDLTEEIRPYTLTGNIQSLRWAALISLARMDDGAAATEVNRRVRKLPVNDDVVYSVLPDLVYTRNKNSIDYMIEVLQRDDATCMSADAERQAPIPCGYRIMEQLAPVIKGYPLALDASGDVKTNDYVAALKTVREWFTKHPNYEILKDKY